MVKFLDQLVFRTMRSLIPVPGIRDDNAAFYGSGREAGAFRTGCERAIKEFLRNAPASLPPAI